MNEEAIFQAAAEMSVDERAHYLDAACQGQPALRTRVERFKIIKLGAAFYNLSQLMRKLFGFGAPKQLAAAMERGGRALQRRRNYTHSQA